LQRKAANDSHDNYQRELRNHADTMTQLAGMKDKVAAAEDAAAAAKAARDRIEIEIR
jgi:hypothetical protein